jgi:hypothetical protein
MSTVRIQLRRGLASEWAAADAIGDGVVLAPGEVGFITDENTFKVGNGDDTFGDLPYILESSLGDYIPLSQFGTPSGVATLDSSGILNVSQLPALAKVTVASAANQAARLALTAQPGDIAIQTDNGQSYVLAASPASTDGNWQALVGSEAVVDTVEAALLAGTGLDKTYDDANGTITIDIDSTVATKTYADLAVSTHSADTTDVHGIANTALLLTTTGTESISNKTLATNLSANGFQVVGLGAPSGNSDAATKSYVDTSISNLVDTAPATLDTLNELAAALGDDAAFSTTVTNSIATKLPLAGGTMSGNINMGGTNIITNLPTPTNDGDVTSKSYVDEEITSSANALTTAYETYANDKAIEMADLAEAAAISAAGLAAEDAIEAHRLVTTSIHGISDTANLAYQSHIDTHNLDTTNVHGIADTAALITSTGVDTKISTAIGTEVTDRNAAISTAIGTEVNDRNTAIGTHSADTTAVHGIADTSALALTATVDSALALKSNIEGPTFTGTVTVPTLSVTTTATGITKSMVGLDSVDNTADSAKPVSTATQTALDLKANLAAPTFTGTVVLPSTTSIGDVSSTELGYLNDVTSAIQTQLDDKLSKTGGTMTGALTLSADPSASLHAATKQYVDNTASGVIAKPQVLGATTANLDATYSNGTAGVGATLTHNTNGAFPSGAGGASGWAVGKGILVKNQTNKAQNGRYYVSDMGSASTPYVLTRCSYCDEASEIPGAYIFVQDGTFAGTGWIQVVADPATFVVGTDNIDVFQFSGSGTITAGTGITVSGNEVSISTGAITSSLILDGTIVDGDINASAAIAQSKISGLTSDLAAKAPIATPTFTGLVTVAASGIAFTDGTQTKEGVQSRTPIIQKTASYTLSALTERDSMIEMGSASALTLTIPTNATVAWPVGTSIDILQTGAGQVTIAGAGGVTVNGTPGLKLRTQWSGVTLFKRATDTWVVYGDLTA